MRIRTAIIVASLIVGAMFAFRYVMWREINIWAKQAVELSLTQRILLTIASAWDRFWVLGAQAIFGLMLLISFITYRPATRRQ